MARVKKLMIKVTVYYVMEYAADLLRMWMAIDDGRGELWMVTAANPITKELQQLKRNRLQQLAQRLVSRMFWT